MTAAATVTAETGVHYLERDGTEIEKDWFLDRLIAGSERIRELDDAHETFMQQQQ